jgi:hypothetical protein
LPPGLIEKYNAQAASLDEPAAFRTKDHLLAILVEQLAATLAALE